MTEFFKEFDREAKLKASKEKTELPKAFSAERLFETLEWRWSRGENEAAPVRMEMLKALTNLRKKGVRTCAITNNWVDDRPILKADTGSFMVYLNAFFDCVVESAKVGVRKPDKQIFLHALEKINVAPENSVFLDDLGVNLKAAKALGMQCIKVERYMESLEELESLTGLKLVESCPFTVSPPPSVPSKIAHSFINVTSTTKLHFVEAGSGPAVILLHGFPDTWYGYRHQIPALACAGFRAIAVDQRGYGDSSAPAAIEEYTQEKLCADILGLMDSLAIAEAVMVGHDWGASVAWNLALMHPERVRGVCGVNNPFYPVNPKRDPLSSLERRPGVFDYMLYFQKPGVAEQELNANVEHSLTCILRGYHEQQDMLVTHNVREKGGILKGFSDSLQPSTFLTSFDIEYYAQQFCKNGFAGPLNWYRNLVPNWKWRLTVKDRKITVPALMVTSENDPVLRPEFSYGMEERVTNLERLHIENCGHWVLQEKSEEFNHGLIKWLSNIDKIKSKL